MNRRALLALVVAVVGASAAPAPKYIPLDLDRMVAVADRIVVGTIREVRAETFLLDVEEDLHGEPTEGPLEVQRFRDWTCASRWTPYATGQRVVLFLREHVGAAEGDEPRREWRILSGGGEGEMPVFERGEGEAREACVALRGLALPDGALTRTGAGVPVRGWVLPLADVVDDVRAWRADYRTVGLEGPVYDRRPRIETTRTRDELHALAVSKRPLLAHLAKRLRGNVVHLK